MKPLIRKLFNDILHGNPLESCRGPLGVPDGEPLSFPNSFVELYRLPYPERFNNVVMKIKIDAFPIIHLQYSGGQSLYKYAAAASTSHAYMSLISILKHTRGEQPPTDVLQFERRRGREVKKVKEKERERESKVFVTLNP